MPILSYYICDDGVFRTRVNCSIETLNLKYWKLDFSLNNILVWSSGAEKST